MLARISVLASRWLARLAVAGGVAAGVVGMAAGVAGGSAAWFSPPPEYEGRLGTYRPVLLFADGTAVRTASDWQRRRGELVREWREFLGPWPELLDLPRHRVVGETNRVGVRQGRLELEVAAGLFTPAYLLVPPGSGRRPAMLVVYYDAETSVGLNPKQSLRDFAWELAKRGFVTLAIGTPAGTAWKPELNGARCQPLSFYAYVAANCWRFLSEVPEVDAQRIGVMGHSYGGKWALFAGALWEPFACVVVSDPGVVFDEGRPNVNYWEPWYLGWEEEVTRRPGVPSLENPRTGAYRRLVAAGRDLHELQALLAPRPFLVSGGAEDPPSRWLALNHAVAVNRVLGFTNRVALTQRAGHDPTEASNGQIYEFLERFLGGGAGAGGRGGLGE